MATLLPALFGFLAGVLSATVTPAIQWNIEKRRLKFNHRRELISSWYGMIEELAKVPHEDLGGAIALNKVFYTLMPYFNEEEWNKDTDKYVDDGQLIPSDKIIHPLLSRILESVNKIEKRWGLV